MDEEDVELKWFQKGWFSTIFLIIFPFFGIPLMWILTKSYGVVVKIIFTILFGIWAAALVIVPLFVINLMKADQVPTDAYGNPINVEEVTWGYGTKDGAVVEEKKGFTMPSLDFFGGSDEEEGEAPAEGEAPVAAPAEGEAPATAPAESEAPVEGELPIPPEVEMVLDAPESA